jgi:hypothetical protein
MPAPDRLQLDTMVAEATADCYDRDECETGFFTMIADNLALPFQTRVLGVDVTVDDIDLSGGGQVVAICARDGWRQPIPILDLPLPAPAPAGAEWIEAYRHWLR